MDFGRILGEFLYNVGSRFGTAWENLKYCRIILVKFLEQYRKDTELSYKLSTKVFISLTLAVLEHFGRITEHFCKTVFSWVGWWKGGKAIFRTTDRSQKQLNFWE